jgi:cysteine desulfuration protein SufE
MRAGMTSTIDTIRQDFTFLDEWEERYRYIIDLGAELEPYPEEFRDDVHKVPGCVSQVWLHVERDAGDDPLLRFRGDSDAHIVRGLVAIVLSTYSGKRASEIAALDAFEIFSKIGLTENLSSQRSNGLRSMVKRIREEARVRAPA